MELLLKLTPATDIQQHVLPMLYRGLDSDTPQIHELCLTILPTFANLLDHTNMKNSVLPRIKRLCLSTSTLSVRVNCLLCIGQLLNSLDKWLVVDEVLPFLPQIPSREPAVLMGILGIYKLTLNNDKLGISKEVMASRVLPFLVPLSIENGLSLSQFNAFVALVKQMFQQVETEHRTKLEQLNSVQEERKKLENTMPMKLDESLANLRMQNLPAIPPPANAASNQSASSILHPAQAVSSLSQPKTRDLTRTLTDLDSLLWSNTDLKSNQLSSFYQQPPHSFQDNPTPQWSTQPPNIQQFKNWGSFNSATPLSPHSSQSSNQQVGSLSKDDIMDLLS